MSDRPRKPKTKKTRIEVEGVRPPLWKSHAFIIAVILALAGAAVWVYAMTTAPEPATASSTSGLAHGLAPGETPPPTEPEQRIIDDVGPILAKTAGSFVVGFIIAYFFKSVIKVVAFVLIIAAVGAVALDLVGAIDIPWASTGKKITESAEQLKDRAGGFRDYLHGVLPSGAAFIVGTFFGLRFG